MAFYHEDGSSVTLRYICTTYQKLQGHNQQSKNFSTIYSTPYLPLFESNIAYARPDPNVVIGSQDGYLKENLMPFRSPPEISFS
jgi:hypothetical protein